jgi:hypothetical protein
MTSTIFYGLVEQRLAARGRTFFAAYGSSSTLPLILLKDFVHLLEDINANFYGLVEQRVASRGRTFIAAYGSSFSDYIDIVDLFGPTDPSK